MLSEKTPYKVQASYSPYDEIDDAEDSSERSLDLASDEDEPAPVAIDLTDLVSDIEKALAAADQRRLFALETRIIRM